MNGLPVPPWDCYLKDTVYHINSKQNTKSAISSTRNCTVESIHHAILGDALTHSGLNKSNCALGEAFEWKTSKQLLFGWEQIADCRLHGRNKQQQGLCVDSLLDKWEPGSLTNSDVHYIQKQDGGVVKTSVLPFLSHHWRMNWHQSCDRDVNRSCGRSWKAPQGERVPLRPSAAAPARTRARASVPAPRLSSGRQLWMKESAATFRLSQSYY